MDSRKIEMIKLALPRETISGLEELELVSRELAARNFAIGDVF